jgi:hypothetical protein
VQFGQYNGFFEGTGILVDEWPRTLSVELESPATLDNSV